MSELKVENVSYRYKGEAGLVFGDLPELTVKTFDNVRRVYDFPDL